MDLSIYICRCIKRVPRGPPTEQARCHGGKVMRMFNIKNKSAMPYIVTHERTGRVGQRHFEDSILFTKSFEEWEDANDYLESLSSSIKKHHPVIGCYSNFDGTFLVIQDDHYDCLDRIYIESEYEANYAATFGVNEVENQRMAKFCEEHHKHAHVGSAGEYVRVFFMPTGLGNIVKIQCLTCGAVEDVTDYDAW